MATSPNYKREKIYLSPDEIKNLREKAARKHLSLSNYIRQKLNLPIIRRGAPTGNQNARKVKGK